MLNKVDPQHFGTVPDSKTTYALMCMLQQWNGATDGNGASARILLFDFKKAFDLVDHSILMQKFISYDIPKSIINWILDFLFN